MNYVVIFAGGTGQRMGESAVPKQFLIANSKPIIVHTIEHFEKCDSIDRIVVVCLESYIDYMKSLATEWGLKKVVDVISGGNNGQQSIYFGLKHIATRFGIHDDDIVLIHDGVRPLIDNKLIVDNIKCVKEYGNAVTVCKATETVVLLNEQCVVDRVLDRTFCNIAKAPQSFYLKDIYGCHEKAISEGKNDFIDSAAMVQYYGHEIHTVVGSVQNIKITTPLDYFLFKAILDAKESEQIKLM